MPECTACGEKVAAGASACPRCGEVVTDATESFTPVGAQTAASDVAGPDIADSPALVVRKGPQPGERFYLERDTLTVGRDPESDIFLNDMTVSRRHATLQRVGHEISVRDDGSLNGTYVNGVCVDTALLNPGDVVQIGTFQMLFVAGAGGGPE